MDISQPNYFIINQQLILNLMDISQPNYFIISQQALNLMDISQSNFSYVNQQAWNLLDTDESDLIGLKSQSPSHESKSHSPVTKFSLLKYIIEQKCSLKPLCALQLLSAILRNFHIYFIDIIFH